MASSPLIRWTRRFATAEYDTFLISPRFNVQLAAVMSVALTLLGWLITTERINWVDPGAPTFRNVAPAWAVTTLVIWIGSALVLSMIAAVVVLIRWGNDALYRSIVFSYSVLLLVQIALEHLLTVLFTPQMTIFISILHVSYRVSQLWAYRSTISRTVQTTPGRTAVLWMVTAGLVFWGVDLLFLWGVAGWQIFHLW
jgi:hypothetical protein